MVQYVSTLRMCAMGFAALVAAFFTRLNIYLTNQYLTYSLPGDGITREYYWRVWNRMHAEDEDRKWLR